MFRDYRSSERNITNTIGPIAAHDLDSLPCARSVHSVSTGALCASVPQPTHAQLQSPLQILAVPSLTLAKPQPNFLTISRAAPAVVSPLSSVAQSHLSHQRRVIAVVANPPSKSAREAALFLGSLSTFNARHCHRSSNALRSPTLCRMIRQWN